MVGGRALLQSDRMANLLIDVLREYMRRGEFVVHDFVIMPNHFHVLMTIPGSNSLEKAVQLIKGSFSFRAHRELEYKHDLWQRGYSDVRITDSESFQKHRMYIDQNPVRAGLASSPEEYAFGSAHLKQVKKAAAKAHTNSDFVGTTEVVP
jgi:putative transposase